MKKKRILLILAIFLLPLFFIMSLMFVGCALDEQLWNAREETEHKVAEQEVKEEQKEQIRALEGNEKSSREEETIAAEDSGEESSFPDEPVTYTGSANGATVILIVDFKAMEVTGSISLTGDDYINADITEGKIDIDTFDITAKYSGTGRLESEGEDYPVSGTITGKITDDLSLFDGIILPDIEDTAGTEFTATR